MKKAARGGTPPVIPLILAAALAAASLPAHPSEAAAARRAPAAPAAQQAPAPAAPATEGGEAMVRPDPAPRAADPRAEYMSLLVASENGDVRAMLALGLLYEQGRGTARNFTSALRCYERAAFAGSAEGWFRLGAAQEVGLGAEADPRKAAESWRRGADMGFAPAQHGYARLLLTGTGVARDERQGIAFLMKAAATHPLAGHDMGIIQLEGLHGQKKDEAKARQSFAAAASLGHVGSMLRLAEMRRDGRGGPANLPGALTWYLVVMKSGLGNDDVARAAAGIRPRLSAAQAAAAEREADERLAAFRAGRPKK